MTTKLPAALASIPTYERHAPDRKTYRRYYLVDDITQLLARLGAVTDEMVQKALNAESHENRPIWSWLPTPHEKRIMRIALGAALSAAPPAGSAMVEALQACADWMYDYADPNGSFERIGQMYYLETGKLRPGKDSPAAAGPCDTNSEESIRAFAEWCKTKHTAIRERARALLAGRT